MTDDVAKTRAALIEFDKRTPDPRNFTAPRPIELREATDGSGQLLFQGYASVTNYPYEMYGGPPYGWMEIMQRGAFRITLANKADVQLLVNHTGAPLARTKSGTMTLSEDEVGLFCEANLEPTDPDVQALAPKMRRGDLDEMSFAGWFLRSQWEEEDGTIGDPATAPIRRVLEVKLDKGDNSIVNYGANPGTAGATLTRALSDLKSGRMLSPQQRHVVLVALGDIDLEGDLGDGGGDWTEGDETETEAALAAAAANTHARAYLAARGAIPS